MAEGVDSSWSKPTPAQLKAAGKSFIGAYLNDPGSKGITSALLKSYLDNGIAVYLIWEGTGRETLNGAAGGAAAGNSAKSLLAGLGLPASTNVYYAVDYDASAAQLATIDAFLNAASAAQGHKASVYGGYNVIEHCVRGSAAYGFQTYAWSGGKVSSKTAIYQYLNGQTLAGNSVDLNRNLKADFGAVNGATLGASSGGSSTPTVVGVNRSVKDIQNFLIKQGISVGSTGADGIYGANTRAGVKTYQKKVGLDDDGIWGPKTDAKAFPTASKPAPTPATPKAPAYPLPAGYYYGPRSGPVQSVSGYVAPYGGPNGAAGLKQWQQRMKDRGNTITVDGLYGPQTQTIATNFQKQCKLTVDGKIGPQTWAAAWTAPITSQSLS